MAEDDMIVLVVVDDDEKANISENESPAVNVKVDDLLETAQKHGQFIQVKLEPEDDNPCDFLDYDMTSEIATNTKVEIKQEIDDDYIPEDDECAQLDQSDKWISGKRHRFTMLKPWEQRSFVEDLRQKYEELREDEELLVNTLEQIMRTVQAPPPPKDYYIMNGIMFECVQCEFLSDTIPAAARHYQEKHGERYLVCYACGVDFRSTTNLYKHEKRCIAPDADVVLKARAAFLGRKGRSRPYLSSNKFKTNKQTKYPCSFCSAVFITKSNLESHQNLHLGKRPYRCHACPCAYTSSSALSRHAKKHTDIQFICDHCSRSFKIREALVAHMDTHKPMRKHGCTECRRRFAQKSALKLHIDRDHRNLPPPCACQICPKRYPRMSLLKTHMKRAHGMTIITRKMFFKSLPTMSELEMKQQSKIILKSQEKDYYSDNRELLQKSFHDNIHNNNENDNVNDENENGNAENDDKNVENEEIKVKSEVTHERVESDEQTDITMSDLLQYMKHQEIGSNVIYIQNGEVVNIDDEDKLVLKVETTVDGKLFLEAVMNNNKDTNSRILMNEDL